MMHHWSVRIIELSPQPPTAVSWQASGETAAGHAAGGNSSHLLDLWSFDLRLGGGTVWRTETLEKHQLSIMHQASKRKHQCQLWINIQLFFDFSRCSFWHCLNMECPELKVATASPDLSIIRMFKRLQPWLAYSQHLLAVNHWKVTCNTCSCMGQTYTILSAVWQSWARDVWRTFTELRSEFWPMLQVNVTLPSGRSETISLPESSTAGDLRRRAQKALGQRFLRLVSKGHVLADPQETLQAAGLQDEHFTYLAHCTTSHNSHIFQHHFSQFTHLTTPRLIFNTSRNTISHYSHILTTPFLTLYTSSYNTTSYKLRTHTYHNSHISHLTIHRSANTTSYNSHITIHTSHATISHNSHILNATSHNAHVSHHHFLRFTHLATPLLISHCGCIFLERQTAQRTLWQEALLVWQRW